MNRFNRFALSSVLSILSLSALAQTSGGSGPAMPPNGQPPAPPPEAIAACSGKSAGTQVQFTNRGGVQITGVCQLIGGVLAARPTGRPAGGPPPAPSN